MILSATETVPPNLHLTLNIPTLHSFFITQKTVTIIFLDIEKNLSDRLKLDISNDANNDIRSKTSYCERYLSFIQLPCFQ